MWDPASGTGLAWPDELPGAVGEEAGLGEQRWAWPPGPAPRPAPASLLTRASSQPVPVGAARISVSNYPSARARMLGRLGMMGDGPWAKLCRGKKTKGQRCAQKLRQPSSDIQGAEGWGGLRWWGSLWELRPSTHGLFPWAEVLCWLLSPPPDLHLSLRSFSSYWGKLIRNQYWISGLHEAISHCLVHFSTVSQNESK